MTDLRDALPTPCGVIVDQPAPKRTDGPAIWPLVIADMQARDAIGRERYGTPLQAFNGRDPLVDAYQELLDGAVYLRQAIEERTALPPDPAPTGERRPCDGWEEEGNEWVMCAGAFLLVVWVRECKDDAGNATHGWRVNDGEHRARSDDDVAFCAYTVPLTLEAAQLAAEDAAAELLRAGLRALGVAK
jgi:hypothetical protein